MSFNTRMAQSAVTLADHFGAALTFTRSTEGAYNPATSVSAVVDTSFTGTGAEVDYKLNEIDGERILQGDKKIMMSAMDTAPEVGDSVAVGGINYKVLHSKPRNNAGTVIGYDLQVRV